jgi:hypothetical protein
VHPVTYSGYEIVHPAGNPLVPVLVQPDALNGASVANVIVDPETLALATTEVPLSVATQAVSAVEAGWHAAGSPVIVKDVALDVPEMALAARSVQTRPYPWLSCTMRYETVPVGPEAYPVNVPVNELSENFAAFLCSATTSSSRQIRESVESLNSTR